MFFRITFILGTILSLLFVLLCSYVLIIDQSIASEGRSVSVLFLITNLFFLLSNFILNKIRKCTSEDNLVPTKIKNIGKIVFVFTIISIVAVLFSGIAAFLSSIYSDKVILGNHSFYFFILITLIILSGVFATINIVYYQQVSRNNRKIMKQLIDDIRLTKII